MTWSGFRQESMPWKFTTYICGLSLFTRLSLLMVCRVYEGSFKDYNRSGWPLAETTDENALKVERTIREDPRRTYTQICTTPGIASPSVRWILHQKLHVRKLCSRWIPHNFLTEQKRARADWRREMLDKFDGERLKNIFNILIRDEIWMYQYGGKRSGNRCCGSFQRKILQQSVETKKCWGRYALNPLLVAIVGTKKVCNKWYITNWLPKMFEALRQTARKLGMRGILFNHDNASDYAGRGTTACLTESRVETLSHPVYSPDLTPCDFSSLMWKTKSIQMTKSCMWRAYFYHARRSMAFYIPKMVWANQILHSVWWRVIWDDVKLTLNNFRFLSHSFSNLSEWSSHWISLLI